MLFPYWVLTIFIIPTLIVIGGIYIIESSYEQKVDQKISEIKDKLLLQKQKIESDFENIIKTQEGFTKLNGWMSLDQVNSYDFKIGGIPQIVEKEKREIAQYMINEFGFQSFGVTLLNGQMYFLEPFADQLSLSKYNFEDREWFQGVLNYKETYVSDVFTSSATGHPIIVISTPLFSKNGEIIGMWGGGIDLEFLSSYLDEFRDVSSNVILIDDNDLVIANSGDFDYHGIASDALLRAKLSQDSYFFENDSSTHVFYTVIKLKNKEWPFFTTIAEDKFLLDGKQKKLEAYSLLISMEIFLVIITFYVFRNIKRNYRLSQNLQENQEKLLTQEKLSTIGKLSAMFAHDIRNPLSNLKMAIGLIQSNEDMVSNPSIKEKFQIIEKNLARIDHQVNEVLDFIRIRPLDKKEISLLSCISESISSMKIPQNIKMHISNKDVKIFGDQNHLHVVFKNLILNAIQAIDDQEGNIKIRISEDSIHGIVEIEDSGPGFPQNKEFKIFEPLSSSKTSGVGLGLVSCKTIIENHGGDISTKNNPTIVTIQLPKK